MDVHCCAGEHGNPAEGFHQQERCSDSRTMFDSNFGVAVMFGMRKIDFFPFLNRHSAKFSIGSVRKFSAAVQVEEVPEEFNSRFYLKVNFAKYFEIADVGHRVRSNVLRMELEAGKYITEMF